MDNLRYIIRKTLSEAVKKRKHYTTWKKLMGEDIEEINATVGDIVAKVTNQLGISKYHLAGTGTQGYAYYIPNNRILKITTDRSEPVESKKIMGKHCKHLADIYNVFTLKGKYEGVYVVISELLDKSEKVDEAYEDLGLCLKVIGTHGDVNRLFSRYKDGILKKDEMESIYQRIKALPVSDTSRYKDTEKESALWMFKELLELIDELNSNNIHSTDYVSVNLGLKKNGRLAMHDLGYSPNKDSDAEILHIDELKKIKKQTVYVLVGPPSVGKSTFIKNNPSFKNVHIISRDDIVVQVAKKFGLTYDDLFLYPPQDSKLGEKVKGMESFGAVVDNTHPTMKDNFPMAYENILKINSIVDDAVSSKFSNAIETKKDIVVDMTNMTAKSREINLKPLEGHDIKKVAIIFNFQDKDALDIISRLSQRRGEEIKKQGGSKTISKEIIQRIINSYEEISPAENYDKIININTLNNLRTISEYDTIPNLDYPDFLDPQYNKGMQNTPYPPMENPNRAPMRETQISQEDLEKKNLPLKHHNLWSEFLQANSAALGDILPTLSRQYANIETLDTIKSVSKDNPALYDQFAEWIFNHLKK